MKVLRDENLKIPNKNVNIFQFIHLMFMFSYESEFSHCPKCD